MQTTPPSEAQPAQAFPLPGGISAQFGHSVMAQAWAHTPRKKEQAKTYNENLKDMLAAGLAFAKHQDGEQVDLSPWLNRIPKELVKGPNPFLHPTEEEQKEGVQYSILHVKPTKEVEEVMEDTTQ